MGPRIVRWYRWSVVYVFVYQVDQVTGLGGYVFVNITVLWGKKGIRRQTDFSAATDPILTPKNNCCVHKDITCNASDLVSFTYRDMDQGPVIFSHI